MKTDLIRGFTANYLQKVDSAKRQRVELQEKIDAARQKIAWLQKRIVRLSRLQERIERSWWTDEIVAPVMAQVMRRTPGVAWDIERLTVHGL